jgi:hypothetical protein
VLSTDFAGVPELREQAAEATVTATCPCGCPSVTLHVPGGPPASACRSRLAPAEARRAPDDELPTDVILFLDDGRLAGLELVWYSDAPPTSWPPAGELRLLPRR